MQPLDAGEPTVMGPFRLLGRLGSGGMGRVYLGRSVGGRTVAVKVVHPHYALDEEFRARFRREVEAARRVGGDWTAPVLDADPEAPVPWVATGYVAGPSLAQAIGSSAALAPGPGTEPGPGPGPAAGADRSAAQPAAPTDAVPATPLPERSVRILGAGLAEALAHVHSLGLVHRDVKPSNVLLTMDGPRLIDFGIARATDGTASLTSTGASIGSPGYMAPEQILGKGVTGASDVFSLGAVLAYAATGRPPFAGDASAVLLYKVVHEEPELDGFDALDGELRDVVARCLAKDPATRPSPDALARLLVPEGAAQAVASGWLPGPLVAEVGRSAVRLLDLEGGEPAGVSEVPGASWVPGVSEMPGVFGPPDPSYADPSYAGPAHEGPSHVDPSYASPAYANPSYPQAGPVPPAGATPGAPGKGKLSVSVAANSAPGANGRGRRLSCTVALAVAGALAVVTVGSAFIFDLMPGGSGGDNSDTGGRPPGATASGNPSPASGVPSRFLGTWTGDVSSAGIPAGTFELVVRQAKQGARFATLTQTDLLGGVCKDELTLKKATDDRIVATGRGAEGNPSHCSQTAHTVYLSPAGDDLKYTSDDPPAGNPEARLSKTD